MEREREREREALSSSNSNSSPVWAAQADDDRRIKLNVGGRFFETTISTIRSGGPDSVLAAISSSSASTSSPIFIDRDPEIFSVLLSLLRTNHLPSAARRFSTRELADESLYYGIESRLRSALSPPPFSGFDASLVSTIRPAADAFPSSFTAAAADGSVWIAHAGQISAYDWTLTRSSTLRTHLDHINSIRRVSPDVAAVASHSAPGLHFYDVSAGRHLASTHWTDPSDTRIYKALVTAIAHSPDSVFASFECRHGENCILAVDKSTLQAQAAVRNQIGRQSGTSTKTAAPTKLTWLPDPGLLAGSLVTRGAFGYAGYIRLWDPRSGDVVWETSEPGSGRSTRFGDPFADVDADPDGCTLFKVCSKSGDVAGADLRKLGEDPWVYLKEKDPSLRPKGGGGAGDSIVVHCYRKQVFVGRDAGLEVWSRFPTGEAGEEEEEDEDDTQTESRGGGKLWEGAYRRVYVDKTEDLGRGIIQRIEGGGNRLFVSREGVEGIEVWESSHLSGAVSLLVD